MFEKADIGKLYNKIGNEGGNGYLEPLKLKREMDFYSEMSRKDDYITGNKLIVKSIDVQITEKCSLKCKDCCNLMQYYERPQDSNLEILFNIHHYIHNVFILFNYLY